MLTWNIRLQFSFRLDVLLVSDNVAFHTDPEEVKITTFVSFVVPESG